MNNLSSQPAGASLAPLVIYLLSAFAFTWAFHLQIIRKKLTTAQGPGRAFYLLGLPGPTLAAIGVAVAFGSTTQLWQRLRPWPIDLACWLLAIFIIPTIYSAATAIQLWRTGLKPSGLFHRPKQGWGTLFKGQLFVVCSEEIGWRGFALPLLIGSLGTAGGTLILGLIWALWHLPMFRVPTSHQQGSFWPYAYSLTAWSIIMTFLVTHSGGSILPAMAFHAAANISFFVMDIPPEAERYITLLLSLVSLLLILFLPGPLIALNP